MKKFKLKVSTWVNGVLTIITKFFSSLNEAIIEAKLWNGIVKVYNHLNQIIHCNVHHCENYA